MKNWLSYNVSEIDSGEDKPDPNWNLTHYVYVRDLDNRADKELEALIFDLHPCLQTFSHPLYVYIRNADPPKERIAEEIKFGEGLHTQLGENLNELRDQFNGPLIIVNGVIQ